MIRSIFPDALCCLVAGTFAAALVLAVPVFAQSKDCTKTSVGFTPLDDLGRGVYLGAEGGLYPGGENLPPPDHLAPGVARGRAIEPLGPSGEPSADGKIVLLTIGMSNTRQESSAFINAYRAFPNASADVIIINGAQGGQPASAIAHPGAVYWTRVDQILADAGLTPGQVQAVWLKQAERQPTELFPDDALRLQGDLESIVGILEARYPNTRLCYLSSRIYAGYAGTLLNPEPYAYQSGFAVKWLIEDQIEGLPALRFEPGPAGEPAAAPWLGWAAYLWADGLIPRSDGLIWECDDLAADGTHPSPKGAAKVAGLLLDFFAADPTARPWFVRCEADMDDSGALDLFDFLAFQSLFAAGSPAADLDDDGALTFFDFLAFQDAFAGGCP